jgi:hypothetical protein
MLPVFLFKKKRGGGNRRKNVINTSGAIQYGVPINDFLLLIVAVILAETPKSASLTSPDSVRRMLAPYDNFTRNFINFIVLNKSFN